MRPSVPALIALMLGCVPQPSAADGRSVVVDPEGSRTVTAQRYRDPAFSYPPPYAPQPYAQPAPAQPRCPDAGSFAVVEPARPRAETRGPIVAESWNDCADLPGTGAPQPQIGVDIQISPGQGDANSQQQGSRRLR